MRILQINTTDTEGGAAAIAWNLFTSYRDRGHDSRLIVDRKHSTDLSVYEIPRPIGPKSREQFFHILDERLKLLDTHVRGIWRIRHLFNLLSKGRPEIERNLGWENFNFPGMQHLIDLVAGESDIVHLHNLHGGYFDLRFLPSLSRQVPTFMTLHDMWLLSGHCAHSLTCERWRTGCGQCPDLELSPAIRRDGTAYNWHRKRSIYRRSQLYVAAPSQWLMNKVSVSMLQQAVVEARVIHNGVDTSVFSPADRQWARGQMNLPLDARILVFVAAHHIKNHPFKDYATLEAALDQVGRENKDCKQLLLIALGQAGPSEIRGNVELRFLPYIHDREEMARIYRSADLYVHAAKADTFPNSILEALACGTPVIATGVGGIPEQIEDGETGIITKPSDPQEMAQAINRLLNDNQLRLSMGKRAAKSVRQRFDLAHQVDQYMNWYQQILEKKMTHALPRYK
jgi:glycosyltransferase involved in cell wall biosynthesis